MGKIIIDRKDEKFLVSIIPYLENTFVVDEIEITEEAKSAIYNRETIQSSVKEFAKYWRETVFKAEEEIQENKIQ